jgi:hypothetical protein
MRVTDSTQDVQWRCTIKRCKQSVSNSTKATKRGMDDLEEVSEVHGDITNNAGPTTAPGEMERGITQDSVEIS